MSMRIGIPLVGGIHWHGGITYLEAIIKAFRALPQDEQPKLYLLIDKSHARDLSAHRYFLNALDGFIVSGDADALPEEISKKSRLIGTFQEVADHVDFIFPVNSDCLPGFAYASWIPDLQHRHLPQLFSEADFLLREEAINFVLAAADNIVVSSETVKKDLTQSYSPFSGQVDVVPFFSRFDPDCFEQNPVATANRYQLPERYLICCNQFWQHKNHDTLFRAIALTKHPVQLVCTGAQEDYRNKDWLAQLKTLIAELGIEDRITLLGFIPRVDQIQLMRRSLAIVQPSLFEGWSTVMEDARGLGKMVIASDLEIHREQAVPNVRYFDPQSASELAALLDQSSIKQLPGTSGTLEKESQIEVGRRQIDSARKLLDLIERSICIYEAKKASSVEGRAVSVAMHQTSRILQLDDRLVEKERVIQEKERAIQQKESVIQQKDSVIQEKESVINKQALAIQAYRLAYYPLRPVLPVFRVMGRAARRCVAILRPRLGHLNQYAPRPFVTSSLATSAKQLTATPKFSIVTPSFQQGDYIERTIQSVLDQQYPNLEYYVQDGGSKDSTVAVLKKYESKLSGWISEKDSGQSQAINHGLARTSGEIMAWLNSDDLLMPGTLAIVADYFNSHPEVDVVYGNRLLIDENDMEIGRWIMPGHDSDVLSWVDYVPQETMFWRRRIWESVGGQIDESFRFAMDWDLLVRFREAGAKFAHIPRFLGAFRIHQQQKTSAAINEIGHQEMDRIRERLFGRVPGCKEIRKAIAPFLLKHCVVDMAYRIKMRLRCKK